MAVTERLLRFAYAAPHLLPIEAPGGTSIRLAVERWAREHGWPLAPTPRDADLMVLCGTPPEGLQAAVRRVYANVPFPRGTVELADTDEVGPALTDAAATLTDRSRQRSAAARALDEEAVDFRHGDVTGWLGSNEGDGPPAGMTLAYRAAARDDLTLDVLHIPLGPILPAWVTGLRVRMRVQGDIVQATAVDAACLAGTGRLAASFWDEPFRAALDGRPVAVTTAERRRAVSHLDSLVRLFAVAGDPGTGARLAGVRDAAAAGEDAAACREALAAVRRRIDRQRLLDRLTAGLAVLAPDEARRVNVTGPAARASGIAEDARTGDPGYDGFEPVVAVGDGDTRSRWRQLLAEAEQSLGLCRIARTLEPADGRVEGPRGQLARSSPFAPSSWLVWAMQDLLIGHVWSNVRYVIASFDPDPIHLAATGTPSRRDVEPARV